MTEAFLQYVWQYQLLEGPLTTVDGVSVTVQSPGELNHDAGPDFIAARLLVGDVRWAGNVEVHVKSSDWTLHHHSSDKAYNNVVLHVVYHHDKEVALENGTTVPTLELKSFMMDALWDNYEALLNPPQAKSIPCAPHCAALSSLQMSSYMDRLLVERLQHKTDVVKRLLQESKGSWEHCCYWLLAHYFGGKTNALAFELLAKATDMKLLARWKDNPVRVEALLFGQAGLLEGGFEDDYPLQLQADYEALRAGAGLSPIAGYLWKFFRVRPPSFPTLRISQFAQLVSSTRNLFSKLLETTDANKLVAFFDVEASDYWTTHYQFDKSSRACHKKAGRAFCEGLIINAWVPLLFEYGVQHDDQNYKDQAFDILNQLSPENNNVVRIWHQAGVEAQNAAQTQSLLQLYNEYCINRRCLRCRIGYYVIKNTER